MAQWIKQQPANCLHKKSQRIYKKLLELKSELSKNSKHKDSILKEPLISTSENMNYLEVNLTKYMQILHAKTTNQ